MCLFALLAAFAPRIALLLLWLFTPMVNRAFGGFLVPLLGLIFLPFTTLVYAIAYIPGVGLSLLGWFWLAFAFLLDVGSYVGGVRARSRNKTVVVYE